MSCAPKKVSSRGQVSEKLYIKMKQNATLEEVREFLGIVFECWGASGRAGQQPCEKLEATGLAAPETISWLKGLCETETPRLVSLVDAAVTKQTSELQKQLQEVAAAPSLKDEREYRDFLTARSSAWARSVSAMLGEHATLESTLTLLRSMLEKVGAELMERARLEAWEAHARKWHGVAQTLGSHVTWFACLTLFRSPLVGGASSEAKKTTQKLQAVLETWLRSNWPKAPPSRSFPREILDAAVRDMAAAVPRPLFCCLGSHIIPLHIRAQMLHALQCKPCCVRCVASHTRGVHLERQTVVESTVK